MHVATFPVLLLLAACTSASPAAAPSEARSDGQVALVDGMQVTGTGRVVAVPDRPVRFCGGGPGSDIGYLPVMEPAPTFCGLGVDVVGVDLTALTESRTKDGATEGQATLTGTFRAGVVTVEVQQPPVAAPAGRRTQASPCPEPSGGWPAAGADGDLSRAQEQAVYTFATTHPDQDRPMRVLHPTEDTIVFGVAVKDDAERAVAERLLRPALGGGLCLVERQVTPAELDAARSEPALQTGSAEGSGLFFGSAVVTGEDIQPVYELYPVWVTPEMRAAADRHAAGLVRFEPELRPA